jgi:hypothetical protein
MLKKYLILVPAKLKILKRASEHESLMSCHHFNITFENITFEFKQEAILKFETTIIT